ncbi:nucleolar protein dao-5 [Rhipicephalus sanguineus]|uniref:nucleolar protein dao-5 n=1 Tax=Rhipicephalus sanguineus TaxID=34632 RepID=UPI0018930A05|nr:nucleolar protein dao-5 [Rhipicephalus sanguineus]
MEHLAKFIQVGPSNALFSQIRFIQPNDDWLSIQRFKAIEVKLCNVLEKKLPDVVSAKPGALESVNGDLTLEDVKVTYNMKKRANLPPFVIVARKDDAKWEARKAKHVDESICKFKDYGGMFERKAVLKSELTVSIRRLTTSELAQQAKVQNSQTTQNNTSRGISGYFKPAAAPRPKTPEEKTALKRLLDRREAKKRHISSSDSESNSASENFETHKSKRLDRKLVPPPRSETPKDATSRAEGDGKKIASLSQPVPEKRVPLQDTTQQDEDRISATQVSKPTAVAISRGGSPSVRSGWSRHHDQHRADASLKDADKPKTSSHRGEREKAKSHDPPPAAAASSSRGAGSSGSSREKEHKTRTEHRELRERNTAASHSQKVEKESSSSKSSRSGKEKESTQGKSRHHRDRHDKHSSSKKTSTSHRQDKSSSKGSSHAPKDREDKSKQSKMKQANIKQLLTDCGIDDSDSDGEAPAPKKVCDETSRRSPDSTQQVDVRVVPHASRSSSAKRVSLEDFQSKKEPSQAAPSGAKRLKQAESVLSKSLFVEDEENSDESGDDKPRRETTGKSPTTEDDAPTVDTAKQAAQSSPEMDTYEPTPVVRPPTDVEDDESGPSKPAGMVVTSDEEVSKLTRTPPRRESYVPSYRGTPTRPEALSYDPSSPKRQEEKRRRRDPPVEYIPSSIGPTGAAKPSRGRYEEYVPEAVNRSARHQQSTMEYIPTYIPTPKREISSDVSTTTYSPLPLSEVPETKNQPGNSFVPSARVEREIRNARDVKDLEERHIRYLLKKCLPELEGIRAGKIESWRRTDYFKGGKAKRSLTYKVFFAPFSEKQIDVIIDLLMEEFAQKEVSGDYLNQVLMPEFMIRVYMANKGTTAEESDRLMAETRLVHNIPLR